MNDDIPGPVEDAAARRTRLKALRAAAGGLDYSSPRQQAATRSALTSPRAGALGMAAAERVSSAVSCGFLGAASRGRPRLEELCRRLCSVGGASGARMLTAALDRLLRLQGYRGGGGDGGGGGNGGGDCGSGMDELSAPSSGELVGATPLRSWAPNRSPLSPWPSIPPMLPHRSLAPEHLSPPLCRNTH